MNLSWAKALAIVLILNPTPTLSQDDTNTDVQVPAPTAIPTTIPDGDSPETPAADTIDPAAQPTAEPAPDDFPDPQPDAETPEGGGDQDYFNVIPHLPEGCDDIRVFSIRGSDEPYPGRGGAMLGVMCSLFENEGVSCDYEDVVYPANISFSGIFCESANIGALAGQAQMTEYAQRCPDSKLVLMGYSQGAGVAGDILGGGGGPIFGCEQARNPPLSRDSAPGSKVAAAIMMGGPRHTANQTYNIGRGYAFDGVAGRHGQQLSDLHKYEDVVAEWCNEGDPVCAVGSEPVNITAHWSYYDEYSEVASRWVVAIALGHTDVRLDLDLSGQDQSVLLSGSNSTDQNGTGSGTSNDSQEDAAVSLLNLSIEVIRPLSIIAVIATAFNFMPLP
ncbi:hypothetical protein PV10_06575 [Exophiala mesophila]|uniref:Cutinase n=1 Tax=Exophiala mesophila TaxID=212818 RepID=A0A0D1ZDW0_EXOME|nr:uncharacterized protein PV10_06575 [Exophiala mesophila]KIV92109.1 hypothetical protein PV10_06575 [Exophiala mesophila]